MNIEELRSYCLSKSGVTEDFPFDESTLTFKVCEKIFVITGLDNEVFEVNLKCHPERAVELRERYHDVRPGFHMNKRHWNTVNFEGELDDRLLIELIDHSYDCVVAKLPKKQQEILKDES